jgi:hypothetical protein
MSSRWKLEPKIEDTHRNYSGSVAAARFSLMADIYDTVE